MTASDRDLLLALATETRDARAGLEDLAARAGGWLNALPEDARAAAMTELQGFDVLGQRLEALSALLDGLGRGEGAAGLLAAVPLAGMAARLTGGAPTASAAPVAAGDLVLFD